MKQTLQRIWREDQGVLSFEWILLLTLLAIGIVGGIAGVRDAIIDEMGDVAQAALAIDQSFVLPGIDTMGIEIPTSSYTDTPVLFQDCARATGPVGQGDELDNDS